MKKRITILLTIACVVMTGCGSKIQSSEIKSDKKTPLEITIWHYYNGSQKSAFDRLVEEFNHTVGQETGVYVEGHAKGTVSELEESVLAAARKEVGSENMPNIFSSYADTAFEIEKAGMLADLSQYFSEEELTEYVDSYIDEGRIGASGELKIFPVAKSAEVLMLNKTAWDAFALESGVSLDELSTRQGVARISELYYNWTDQKTPDIPYDGKAFYGRDAMANLFVINSMQMGIEMFPVANQKVEVNVDRDAFKNIWDLYYIPFMKGHFAAIGRFRSDDLKIGEIVAYTGSVASADYFPDAVELENESIPIECKVLPAPVLENGNNYIIQQGAGMVVSKATKEEEYASCLFLHWFTDKKNNLEFCYDSGYLPVKKEANSKELLDEVIEEENLVMKQKKYDTIITAIDMVNQNTMYAGKAFDGGVQARKILEYNLADKAAEERKQVQDLLAQGISLEDAVRDFISDEAFDDWFVSIKKELEECIQGEHKQ